MTKRLLGDSSSITLENIMDGLYVNLRPMQPQYHAKPLYEILLTQQSLFLWDYLRDGPFDSVDHYCSHLLQLSRQASHGAYIIEDRRNQSILGKLCLLHFDSDAKSLELAYIVFGAKARGTYLGKEAAFLAINSVFEIHDCRICCWRCDSRNIASIKFAQKFGFEQISIISNHMVVRGEVRDTLCFELTRDNWFKAKNSLRELIKL
ncbi:GNAT family N-acetyltransferase [Marinomonas mediterranea]|jgi:Acetyltransferases, including N-acetylases of ribosomal proteins|uniref:GCN5-related N-acetyltransferase n=1 Tax=Marinomonas mediterranea (strain ATCC 700492 / JCM 21426 / NBRC 103028 / MMB-1) TaxID=717774 RepID=F2JX66_MARM1|nr:GNAT family protein [Marinomonas mediterranea]ADZ90672.1 GCN5-related N-acetyltransferase [Marinomonas mediterranea MMB-1]WCN08718.1 GNAT family N-acetyltransferase [Marinomonas mediterranea]WCN16837.1 GNAT family N-acetyltransferase [Marinomonas mediterranea MMB-1]